MCVGKVHGKGHQERYTLKWRKDTPLKTWLNRYRQRWESSKTEPFALQHLILSDQAYSSIQAVCDNRCSKLTG